MFKALKDVSCPSTSFFRWVFRGEDHARGVFPGTIIQTTENSTPSFRKPYIHWHLLRTKLAKMLGNSEWNSRLTENSPSQVFQGIKCSCQRNPGQKLIWISYVHPPVRIKKWKSPLCRNDSETVLHFFCHCSITQNLWTQMQNWLSNILDIPELTSEIYSGKMSMPRCNRHSD